MPHPARAGCWMPTPRRRRDFPIPVRVISGRSTAMPSFKTVAVIGAGAWGTALAGVAARAGRDVVLYARSAASAAEIAATRANPKLSGARLDASVKVTDDIALAAAADIILVATPAQNLREAVTALAPHLARAKPVIACAKGIERGTHKFMTEVIAEAAPDANPAILSGPSFADDVARGLPTAVTLAAGDETLASALVQALGSSTFRPYHTSAVPPKTCWRSRPESWSAGNSAPRRRRR